MKVGVLVQFTSKTDIEAKFTELKELGVDSCQLVCWDRPTLHDDVMVEKINKAIEKFGIHVTAFWCLMSPGRGLTPSTVTTPSFNFQVFVSSKSSAV